MMNEEIFEVTREDYKAFVERLIPGQGHIVEENNFIKIVSNKTEKCWCGRKKIEDEPERYFIFDYPESDEWGPPIPKFKLNLETKEEVQALFDALAKMRKENND